MFTAFRCYSGECITEDGLPVALLLSNQPLGTGHSRSLGDHVWKMFDVAICYFFLILIPLDLYGSFWSRFGWLFVLLYVAGYMLVTMGPLVALGGRSDEQGSKVAHVSFRKRLWHLCFYMFLWNVCLCHKYMIRMNCSRLLTHVAPASSFQTLYFILPQGQFWWCVAWFPSPFPRKFWGIFNVILAVYAPWDAP